MTHTNAKGVRIAIQSFSKLKHITTEIEKRKLYRKANTKWEKRIKGAKPFVSYLGGDVSNASNIEIAHFDIYDPWN